MRPLALHMDDETEVPLVPDRHGIPAARLADNEEVGAGQVLNQMPGPSRVALLPHRAVDQDLPGRRVTARRHERRPEGAFPLTRPSPVEAVAPESDRHG